METPKWFHIVERAKPGHDAPNPTEKAKKKTTNSPEASLIPAMIYQEASTLGK